MWFPNIKRIACISDVLRLSERVVQNYANLFISLIKFFCNSKWQTFILLRIVSLDYQNRMFNITKESWYFIFQTRSLSRYSTAKPQRQKFIVKVLLQWRTWRPTPVKYASPQMLKNYKKILILVLFCVCWSAVCNIAHSKL